MTATLVSRKSRRVMSFVREWVMIIPIILITVVASIVRPAFMSGGNMMNILRAYSTIGIASVGMAFAIIGGGMDLSIGSTISLTAVVTMMIINKQTVDMTVSVQTTFLVLLVGIAIGAVVGLANGAIVAIVNGKSAESFIITYAMQIIVAAIAQAVIKGEFQSAHYNSGLFKQFGIGWMPVFFFFVVAAVLQFVLVETNFGRELFFLGANMRGAKMAGVKIKTVRLISHLICGMCAGLAGVLVVSRTNSASVLQGVGYELDAMACVAVGGTSMDGGSGSVLKTVLGVLVMGFLLTALNVLGIQSNEQLIVRGAVIILAVALDTFNKAAKLKEAVE